MALVRYCVSALEDSSPLNPPNSALYTKTRVHILPTNLALPKVIYFIAVRTITKLNLRHSDKFETRNY